MADYEKYKRHLSESNILEKIESERNIDKKAQGISDAITKAAENLIPNKIITFRPNDPPWITCYIKRLIRKRKLAFRQHKKTNNILYCNKNYKSLRNKVISELRKSKQTCLDNLDKLLSSGDCNSISDKGLRWDFQKIRQNIARYQQNHRLSVTQRTSVL